MNGKFVLTYDREVFPKIFFFCPWILLSPLSRSSPGTFYSVGNRSMNLFTRTLFSVNAPSENTTDVWPTSIFMEKAGEEKIDMN